MMPNKAISSTGKQGCDVYGTIGVRRKLPGVGETPGVTPHFPGGRNAGLKSINLFNCRRDNLIKISF